MITIKRTCNKLRTLVLSGLLSFFAINAAHGVFTFDPTKWFLRNNRENTKNFKDFLDAFFQDELVIDFFIKRTKPIVLDFVQARNSELVRQCIERKQQVQIEAPRYAKLQQKIYEKYGVTDLGAQSHCFILRFKNYPDFVVKLPKAEWPLQFQNISRFFYDKNIRNFTKDANIQYVKPVGKCLYLLPPMLTELKNQNLDEQHVSLNDKYFAVIAKYIPNLPQDNRKDILSLVKKVTFSDPETGKTTEHLVAMTNNNNDQKLVDLLKVMTSDCGGTWDAGKKLFYIEKDGTFMFIDTEESGLDAWRGPQEWNRLDHCVERFGLEKDKLSEKGKIEKQRKIANENNCGLGQLEEIFQTLLKDA